MKIKCPLCGVGELEAIEGLPIVDLVKPGAPSPHELYERTGGGKAFVDAMVEHGYVQLLAEEEG